MFMFVMFMFVFFFAGVAFLCAANPGCGDAAYLAAGAAGPCAGFANIQSHKIIPFSRICQIKNGPRCALLRI